MTATMPATAATTVKPAASATHRARREERGRLVATNDAISVGWTQVRSDGSGGGPPEFSSSGSLPGMASKSTTEFLVLGRGSSARSLPASAALLRRQ